MARHIDTKANGVYIRCNFALGNPMAPPLPELSLSHGQMLWALGHGRAADDTLKDQVRYLRQLGIPTNSSLQAPGRGNRVRYGIHDLIELGLAMTGLRYRFRPKDIQAVLQDDREQLRLHTIFAWGEQPDDILEQDWVKSRQSPDMIIRPEIYLRMHDRRRKSGGHLEILGTERAAPGEGILMPVEVFEDGEYRLIIPVMLLSIPWIAWALEAPSIRTGPK